jgi:cyanophycinase-like exopeptidase
MLNNKKPVYLMAAGKNGSIRRTFLIMQDIIRKTGQAKPTVAFVGVASFKDNWLIYFVISSFIRTFCKCRVKRVVIAPPNADLNKAREILKSADTVFMSGGDVSVGMQVLKQKNMVGYFQELFQQGKQFFGGSAGSILMTREWIQWRDPNDDSTAELFSCLGFVSFICDTHAENDGWAELKTALCLKGDGARGYGIPSGVCLKVYPDGKVEALGGKIAKYVLSQGRVVQEAELSPVDGTDH